jgi:hypothetical protein
LSFDRRNWLHVEDWDDRARKLVGKMTLPEKIEELHGIQDAGHYRYVLPIPRLGIPTLHIANGRADVGWLATIRRSLRQLCQRPLLSRQLGMWGWQNAMASSSV